MSTPQLLQSEASWYIQHFSTYSLLPLQYILVALVSRCVPGPVNLLLLLSSATWVIVSTHISHVGSLIKTTKTSHCT